MAFRNSDIIISSLWRQRYLTNCCCAVLVSLWLIPTLCMAGDNASIIGTISRAWNNREKGVASLDCEWSSQFTIGAKSYGYHDEHGSQFFLPPEDFTVKMEGRFRLGAGYKMRYESRGLMPVQQTRGFEPRSYVSTTDLQDQKCYYGKDEADGQPRYAPLGFVNTQKEILEANSVHLMPLLLLYRPSCLAISIKFDLGNFSARDPRTKDGRELMVLEKMEGGVRKEEIVIDMKRNCVPVLLRHLTRDDAKPETWLTSVAVEILYTETHQGTWKLAGWKTMLLKEGAMVIEQMTAVVKKIDLNPPLADDVFRFEFPVGTLVRNWKTDEHYILQEGGKKRRVTQAEMDAFVPYKRLLVTPSGRGVEEPGTFRPRVLLVASILTFLFVIACLLYWFSIRRRREGMSP